MPEYIIRFDSGYRFLSNFWNCEIEFEGKTYPSTEHAFQAAKTLNDKEREDIKNAATPGAAKRLGKKVTLRPDWESVKYDVMQRVVMEKFNKRKDLQDMLLDTGGKVLVEGNVWHDKTWGVCYCDNCSGTGKNWLGEILMKVREHLLRRVKLQNLHDFVKGDEIDDSDFVDRTHEECAECAHEKTTPPPCKGHCAGPRHCDDFKAADKNNDIELETI